MSLAAERVRLQNLRQLVVQVWHQEKAEIVGTGFVVSADGMVVTAAHVLAAAGAQPKDGQPLSVRVSFGAAPEEPPVRAYLRSQLECFDDDVVLLQADYVPSGVTAESVAKIGSAEGSDGNEFRSFGYRRLANYQGLPAHGYIVGHAARPSSKRWTTEPIVLDSKQIDSGMSGAPVLDVARNLIVGVVCQAWDSGGAPADRDTSFAVDARVLGFDEFGLILQDTAQLLKPTGRPFANKELVRELTMNPPRLEVDRLPPEVQDLIGRESELRELRELWQAPRVRLVSLVGLAGVGKSSLAREFVQIVIGLGETEGIFWWDFNQNPNVDLFLESALAYVTGGRAAGDEYASPSAKMHMLAGVLHIRRILLVLDGLEVLQDQGEHRLGQVLSPELRGLFRFASSLSHDSFCLVTSRIPVVDLEEYITHRMKVIDGFTVDEGREFLGKKGVELPEHDLAGLVQRWEGHPLALSLVSNLWKRGSAGVAALLLPTTASERDEAEIGVDERVMSLLSRYDSHLDEGRKELVGLLGMLRTPVRQCTLKAALDVRTANADDALRASLDDLVRRFVVQFDIRTGHYSLHPLVKANYRRAWMQRSELERVAVHARVAAHYLEAAHETPARPTLEDIVPAIESVHHFLLAGRPDEGWSVAFDRIAYGSRYAICLELGAFDTALAILGEFFPEGDLRNEPRVGEARERLHILRLVGLCLFSLGRVREAQVLYESALLRHKGGADDPHWIAIQVDLAEVLLYLGELSTCEERAQGVLTGAPGMAVTEFANSARALLGRVRTLRGDLRGSLLAFEDLNEGEPPENWGHERLTSRRYLWQAELLAMSGNLDQARRIVERNLEQSRKMRLPRSISQSLRILGRILEAGGREEEAGPYHDEALRIARSTADRAVLIEALTGKGRWLARNQESFDSNSSERPRGGEELEEALDLAVRAGLLLHEADIRAVLARILERTNPELAEAQRKRCRWIVSLTGYALLDVKPAL